MYTVHLKYVELIYFFMFFSYNSFSFRCNTDIYLNLLPPETSFRIVSHHTFMCVCVCVCPLCNIHSFILWTFMLFDGMGELASLGKGECIEKQVRERERVRKQQKQKWNERKATFLEVAAETCNGRDTK